MEKKENGYRYGGKTKQQYRHIMEACRIIDETELPLVNKVYNNINYINNIHIPRWKNLTKVQKAALFFGYVVDKSWAAVTLRFSNAFMENCAGRRKIADFIRRRLNENFKNRMGYVPEYMFCLEFKDKNFHIHGVIKPGDNLETIRDVLKTTAYGRNHVKNPMPENRKLQCVPVYDGGGWGNYILKCCNHPAFDIYISDRIKGMIRKKYRELRRKRYAIKFQLMGLNKGEK